LNEADALLQKLRETKRLKKADQATLVGNLGRLIREFDGENAKTIAKNILHENQWEKRKRYVRFPDEAVGRSAGQAASGGAFAGIIERLIDLFVSRNMDRNQVRTDIVHKVLQRTSLRPPSSFRMAEGADEADAARLVADMSRVCEMLADEADLAEFFALVSKHPIYPPGPWYQWANSLELNSEEEPNHIDAWGWDTDEDEIREWVPWWAPKCVIGHLYIPFECQGLWLPENAAAEIKKTCGSADDYYRNHFAPLLEAFTGQEWMAINPGIPPIAPLADCLPVAK
jgi:hypothetical protein